jgi:hypothetical protein
MNDMNWCAVFGDHKEPHKAKPTKKNFNAINVSFMCPFTNVCMFYILLVFCQFYCRHNFGQTDDYDDDGDGVVAFYFFYSFCGHHIGVIRPTHHI